MAANLNKTKDNELAAVDIAAITIARYAVNDREWFMLVKKRLSARVIEEDNKDSSLSSISSSLKGESNANLSKGIDNRKPGSRLDRGNLAEDAKSNIENENASYNIDVNINNYAAKSKKNNNSEKEDKREINSKSRLIKKRKRDNATS